MNKRPKSREETPKEGSDSARRYRTATICDRAAQKARVFDSFPVQCWSSWRIGNNARNHNLLQYYQMLIEVNPSDPAALQLWYAKTLNFVIAVVDKNFTKPQRRFGIKIPEANLAPTMRRRPD